MSDSAPASAIRIRLETIENARSRRRGTSNACRTCTHRNSAASGIRAASTVAACAHRLRGTGPVAASSPSGEQELQQPGSTGAAAGRRTGSRAAPGPAPRPRSTGCTACCATTAAIAISTASATTTRIAIESSGGPVGRCSSSFIGASRLATGEAGRPGPRPSRQVTASAPAARSATARSVDSVVAERPAIRARPDRTPRGSRPPWGTGRRGRATAPGRDRGRVRPPASGTRARRSRHRGAPRPDRRPGAANDEPARPRRVPGTAGARPRRPDPATSGPSAVPTTSRAPCPWADAAIATDAAAAQARSSGVHASPASADRVDARSRGGASAPPRTRGP